jgi:hypothetical protein
MNYEIFSPIAFIIHNFHLFPIPNSQFPIPNPQFPIPNSPSRRVKRPLCTREQSFPPTFDEYANYKREADITKLKKESDRILPI